MTQSIAMTTDCDRKYRETAIRGKYQGLYAYLRTLATEEWRTSFGEIESILGFALPPSARLHRSWWSNPNNDSGGHSQARAWRAAGWETADVDMNAETLLLRRKRPQAVRRRVYAEVWPVRSVGAWPADLSLRREDIYNERI